MRHDVRGSPMNATTVIQDNREAAGPGAAQLIVPAAAEGSRSSPVATRLEELRALSPRLDAALTAANVTGLRILQVWPNGEQGLPALGLFGECDPNAADRLHVAMAGFVRDLELTRLVYTSDRMREGVNVRPWAHYKDPK